MGIALAPDGRLVVLVVDKVEVLAALSEVVLDSIEDPG